ncbi:hypothetical protein L596_006858 [Steinernema carpocapsae]|uniref:Amidase domain-containing protein n=1 Tax=Steinernema carpocapsae TaxID=34508 RepID=A0A4U5P736_STECR|nr:hypothetical protein L596_006858 [Steinernema carpocapsae]
MHESLVAFLNQQTSSHFRHAATGQQTTNLLSIALRRPSPGVINMFLLGSRSSSSNDFRGFCTTTRDPRQKLRSVHSRFQMDPVVHIFVFLLRTLLYPLIWLFPSLDYPIIQFGFGFVNLFRTRERVPDVEDPLLLISATEAARRIRNKELKSIDIVNSYIYRIKEVNPLINALVSDCFLEAIEEAENVDAYMEFLDDEEIRKLEIEKPLLGIPFTVKDSMDVKGREITVGIVLREGRISKDDAEVIKRTRDAGGILLGMTNVPESLMTIETLNAIFGVTCNPYDTRRSPGGSSGGEGALVSACGSLIGIGSDIGGSIRIPSFHNGIFGLKATQFFVPTKGQLPEGFNNEGFRKNLFSVGPIARYIEDIPLCLKAFNPEGAQALNLDKRIDLQKIKIFYLEEFPKESGVEHLSRVMREKLREVVEFFEKEHKLSAYGITFTELAEVSDMYITSVSSGRPITEFILKEKGDLDGSKLHKEIVKSVFGMSDHILNILMLLYKRSAVRRSNEAKQLVCDKRDRLRQKIIDLLKRENGVILMPSWASPPRFNGYAVWARINVSYTALWNTLSLPVLQCPTGLTADGLPTGIQIVGPPGSENTLLEVGKQVERFYGGWQAPWKK